MKYELKNIMEDVVAYKLTQYIKQLDLCTCEKCYMDVMAIVLNELKPLYVVTEIGEMLANLDATYLQNQVDVECALIKAIRQVKTNPKHDSTVLKNID